MLLVGVNKADIVRIKVALRRFRASVVLVLLLFIVSVCVKAATHAPF
jgi:hypothetical protein